MSRAPLPPGWEECRTESGEIYYQDHNRGVTQWERPAPVAQTVHQNRPAFRQAQAAPVRSKSPPLPAGWAKGVTPGGEVYFIDHNTRTSTWDDPRTTQPAGRVAAHRQDPVGNNHGMAAPRFPARHLEEDRRKEQELLRQKREIEAEKARLDAQLRMEDDFRRKTSELERRRMEIEREKMQLARMKADLARVEHTPERLGRPARGAPPPHRASPYQQAAPAYAAPPARAPRGAPSPRFGTSRVVPVRPPPPVNRTRSPPRGPPARAAVPITPWNCAECGEENRSNKFRCKACTVPRKDIPQPEAAEKRPREPRPAGKPKGLGACRYGAECARPDCRFGHPELHPPDRKPCRFGDGCNKPKCPFAHVVLVSRQQATEAIQNVEGLEFPGLPPAVAEKLKEMYKLGHTVNQMSLELLGQLDETAAVQCITDTLESPERNKSEILKSLIDVQLSTSVVTKKPEKPVVEAKTEKPQEEEEEKEEEKEEKEEEKEEKEEEKEEEEEDGEPPEKKAKTA